MSHPPLTPLRSVPTRIGSSDNRVVFFIQYQSAQYRFYRFYAIPSSGYPRNPSWSTTEQVIDRSLPSTSLSFIDTKIIIKSPTNVSFDFSVERFLGIERLRKTPVTP